ncbi:MAG: WecB/TagA/CpsF family glycosyltransferase [Treponema sp.]|jgi:N-acetylglucosaminyldiphosphoundecaprenol N-acetyl-beta-D-mannosaminyltransferase|nr:WecB/TagA/CpsF family glycosyltransferase [Treponema sp.]
MDKKEIKRDRISLLNVPLDIVQEDDLSFVINELLSSKGSKNIVLLSLWDLLRARRNGDYRSYVTNAALVIPISKSLVSGSRFLRGKEAVRYMPFHFIIKLLSILEVRELSVYLIGGKNKTLKRAESNVSQTFPFLEIIGRHPGYFKKHKESDIIEAIRKASPSLLLVGKGAYGEELWIHKNSDVMGCRIRLWCSDILDVFANKRHHPSDYFFEHGFEWIGFCCRNPLLFFRIFPYLYYKLLLLIYKIRKR